MWRTGPLFFYCVQYATKACCRWRWLLIIFWSVTTKACIFIVLLITNHRARPVRGGNSATLRCILELVEVTRKGHLSCGDLQWIWGNHRLVLWCQISSNAHTRNFLFIFFSFLGLGLGRHQNLIATICDNYSPVPETVIQLEREGFLRYVNLDIRLSI